MAKPNETTPSEPGSTPPAPEPEKEEPSAWEKALQPILDRLKALETNTQAAAPTVTIPVPPKPAKPEEINPAAAITKPKSLLSFLW